MRAGLGREMESEALVGSVHERVGGGGGSCGSGCGRAERVTGDTSKAPGRAPLHARPRDRGRARRLSVVDDIIGRCVRFVNFRFLGPPLTPNCYYRHHKKQERKIRTPFFEPRLFFQHFNLLNTPRAATMTPMTATISPL